MLPSKLDDYHYSLLTALHERRVKVAMDVLALYNSGNGCENATITDAEQELVDTAAEFLAKWIKGDEDAVRD